MQGNMEFMVKLEMNVIKIFVIPQYASSVTMSLFASTYSS